MPGDKKNEVRKILYVFAPVPSLDDDPFDFHEGKRFRDADFQVT